MKTRIRPGSTLPQLNGETRHVLEAPARSMDLSLEVWNGPGQAADRLHLSTACADCQIQQRRAFDRCRKRRSYLARPEARVPATFSETCPRKQRLTRVARPEDGESLVVFGFGYDPAEAEEEADAAVVTFLDDVQVMLREPTENLAELRDLSRARSAAEDGIDRLHLPSGMRNATSQDNHTILEQWSAVLQADLAFAWNPDRDIVALTGPGQSRFDESARASLEQVARRLHEELQQDSDMQVTTLPETHPVARALGSEVHVYCVGLQADGQACGMLCGLRAQPFHPVQPVESQLLLSLSHQMALHWSNVELVQGMKRFLVNTVKTLVSAIEAKDSYTSGHSERVNIISMLLGNELDLDLIDLESLYWGALLHDVGKIGMPESILNKPSPLEQHEFRIVQEHPERGWRMLHAVPELARAAEGIRFHHERWDGGGYPRGLKGEDIPILSRIICVADAFDAIVSNRSYRKGQSPTRAVDLIDECAGEQFDPRVVAALQRLLPLLEKHRWVLMSGQKTSFHY